MSAFVDTNIPLYAAGIDKSASKSPIAYDILNSDWRTAFLVQVLNEFVFRATRPCRPTAIPVLEALLFVNALRRFEVVALDLALFHAAADVQSKTGYAWWDSLIVAAASAAGCDILLTEDMQHGRVVDGVRIVNPFRELA